MKKLLILFALCAVMIGCKSAPEYKIYEAELHFPLYKITVHWSGDKYIIDEMDVIISSGTAEDKGKYYVLTDDLSNEKVLVKIEDKFFIFLNGRFKESILTEDRRAKESEDFESEENRFFAITQFDIEAIKKHLNLPSSKSASDIKGSIFMSHSEDFKLEFNSDSLYAYSYKDFVIEFGRYLQKGNIIHLQSYLNQRYRHDLTEEERNLVESLPITNYIAFIEDSTTIKLGTLPCSRSHNLVRKVDSLPCPGLLQ